jgi:hypothetical protein
VAKKKNNSKKKPAKATHADAELVLKLYDLRRGVGILATKSG